MNASTERVDLRLVTLLGASALAVLVGAPVAPSLPAIHAAFGGSPDLELTVRMVLTLPALWIGLAGAPAGWATDRWGRIPTFVLGLTLYLIAGTAGLWVPSLATLLASRALLGVSVAFVMTAATTLIADHYPGEARRRVVAAQSMSMGLAGIVFSLAGGALADLGWRWPFALYLLSALLIPGAIWRVGEPSAASASSAGDATEADWPLISGLFAAGYLGMVLFYLVPAQLPFLFAERFGSGGAAAGLGITACTVPGVLLAPVFPRLVARFGHAKLLISTFATIGPGYLIVAWAPAMWVALVGLAAAGAGIGLLMPNLGLWQSNLAPLALRGRVLGGQTVAFFLGQFSSPLIVGALRPAGASLAGAFVGAAVAALLCTFVAAFLLRGR